MSRRDRLDQDDYFNEAVPENRPSTYIYLGNASELKNATLYVEKKDLKAQSLIREDDIEVYIRGVSYKNKVARIVNKFLSKAKWIPLKHKFSIYERALKAHQTLKIDNIKR